MLSFFGFSSLLALAAIVCLLAVSPKFSRRNNASLTSVAFSCWLIASVILTSYTFAIRGGGLPDLSIERFLFLALIGVTAVRMRQGRFLHRQTISIEILMLLFTLCCFISMARFGFIETYAEFPRPTYIYVVGYGIPFLMFVFVKRFFVNENEIIVTMKILFWFGCYLAWLSYLERFGPKSLVFPSYITDTSISDMHLDRSRGPFLNGAFNGLALNIMFLCGVMVLPTVKKHMKPIYLLLLALYLPAIYFTRTRSAYVGLLLVIFVMIFLYKTRWSKWKFVPVLLLCACFVLFLNWNKLASSDRKSGGIGEMREVEIRLALMRKSLQLIEDHPLGGIGLAQFRTASLFTPTEVELQHNQLIGLAAELGIPGMLLYASILGLIFVRLYRLAGVIPAGEFLNLNLVMLLTTVLFVDLLNAMLVEPSLHLFANTSFFVFAGISDQLYNKYYLKQAVLPQRALA